MAKNPNFNIRGALLAILNGMAPDEEHEADIAHLCHLIQWFREGAGDSDFEIERRFQMLLETLEQSNELRPQVKGYLEQFLRESRYRYTFAELGILGSETFGQTIKSRIFQRLLPVTVDDKTVRESLNLMFPKADDHVWLESISIENWTMLFQLLEWLDPKLPIWLDIQVEMLDALEILAVRIAALGIEAEVVRCLGMADKHTSPFVEQHIELRAMIAQAHEYLSRHESLSDLGDHLDVLLDQCTDQIKRAYAQARVLGISVTLSMHLTRLEQSIVRMRKLLQLTGALPTEDRVASCVDFFRVLTREENRKHSIVDLWQGLTDKLALRITEHASKAGDHYIAESISEYWKMGRAAVIGGIVIAMFAFLKIWLAALKLPPFWEAMVYSLNYGACFVAIHLLHGTVATKQPAMTAARIASAIESRNGRLRSMDGVVNLISQVARTQFIAIAGNMLLAFSTALLIGYGWTFVFGSPPIDEHKRDLFLHQVNPLLSMAIPHAALAGVALFLTGVVSGYYDNLCIYERVPLRIRKVVWLRKLLGVQRLARLADYTEHNLGAIVGSLFLGLMLGSLGFVGFLLGLPIDTTHFAFSSAQVGYSMQAGGFELGVQGLIFALGGAALIGAGNLSVSFALALYTAVKARGVHHLGVLLLIRNVGSHFLKNPRSFFFPPKIKKDEVVDAQSISGDEA
jgi:site-specific recombinase